MFYEYNQLTYCLFLENNILKNIRYTKYYVKVLQKAIYKFTKPIISMELLFLIKIAINLTVFWKFTNIIFFTK